MCRLNGLLSSLRKAHHGSECSCCQGSSTEVPDTKTKIIMFSFVLFKISFKVKLKLELYLCLLISNKNICKVKPENCHVEVKAMN